MRRCEADGNWDLRFGVFVHWLCSVETCALEPQGFVPCSLAQVLVVAAASECYWCPVGAMVGVQPLESATSRPVVGCSTAI